MGIFNAIILGITEGATEFIPVSSSGHLILVRALLHIQLSGSLAYDAIIQLAATLALVIYLWKDISLLLHTFWLTLMRKNSFPEDKILFWAIIWGTVPGVLFGLLLEKYLDTVFRSTLFVAWGLIIGSILMYVAQKYNKSDKQLSIGRGIIIGFFQCLALIPGMSRSGSTIAGGLITGLSREQAVRFSFLLSIPILLGAGLKSMFDIRHQLGGVSFAPLLVGSIASFIVAFASIHYLLKFLKNHNLNIFIWYRIVIAISIFAFL